MSRGGKSVFMDIIGLSRKDVQTKIDEGAYLIMLYIFIAQDLSPLSLCDMLDIDLDAS